MKKILIVEDNPSNLDLLTFLLEGSGFTVISAADGLSGVQKALTELPDMVLMDIQLPKLDGMQATKKIRKDIRLKKIPIIAVTSYAMPGDREMAIKAGCNGYIEKPIDTDTFVGEIKQYL